MMTTTRRSFFGEIASAIGTLFAGVRLRARPAIEDYSVEVVPGPSYESKRCIDAEALNVFPSWAGVDMARGRDTTDYEIWYNNHAYGIPKLNYTLELSLIFLMPFELSYNHQLPKVSEWITDAIAKFRVTSNGKDPQTVYVRSDMKFWWLRNFAYLNWAVDESLRHDEIRLSDLGISSYPFHLREAILDECYRTTKRHTLTAAGKPNLLESGK